MVRHFDKTNTWSITKNAMRAIVFLLLTCLTLPASALVITPTEPAKGTDGCYNISDANELYWFAEFASKPLTESPRDTLCAKLANDITVNENVLNDVGDPFVDREDALVAWEPITPITEVRKNSYTTTYSQPIIFNGKGHSISGLYIDKPSAQYVGFFDKLGCSSSIQDLGIKDSFIKGGRYVGSVVGYQNCSSASINRVYSSATVLGDSIVGGIAGYVYGNFSFAYSLGIVSGIRKVGGIAGSFRNDGEGLFSASTLLIDERATAKDFAKAGYIFGDTSATSLIKDAIYLNTNPELSGLNVVGYELTLSDFQNRIALDSLNTGFKGFIWQQLDGDDFPSFNFNSTHTISYNLNCSNCPELEDFIVSAGLPTNYSTEAPTYFLGAVPERTGYMFAGWIHSKSKKTIDFIPAGDWGDIKLTANWIETIQIVDGCYEIGNKSDLKKIAQLLNYKAGETTCDLLGNCSIGADNTICVNLSADIVFNENVLKNDSTVNESDFESWTPIRNFAGVFNGKGHTISGLYINDSTKHAAFFDSTTGTAQVRDFGIVNSYFHGDTTAAFAAVGSGKFTKVYNKAYVNGAAYTGGLVAVSNGEEALVIDSSYNAGCVYSSWPMGGIVAQLNAGSISNTHNEGFIKASAPAGGIGYQIYGNLTNVYNKSDIEAYMPSGISYSITGNLKKVYNVGNITSTGAPSEGIAYQIEGDLDSVYNKGMVSSSAISSGIAYSISGNVTNSYNEGNVIGERTAPANGFSYSIMGNVQNVYNTGSINSEQNNANGIAASITGNVDKAYNTGSIFGSGGNSSTISAGIAGHISGTTTNVYNEGDVTSDSASAYGITEVINNSISNVYNSGNITAKVLALGFAQTIMGNVVNSYNQGNITSKGSAPAGGFALSLNGDVKNSYNEGNIISGSIAGGIAPSIGGNVTNVHNTGSVAGVDPTGGIAYSISGNIYNVYNTGNVSSENHSAGGIVAYGSRDKIIANSYNQGNVAGKYQAAGIVGSFTGNIRNVYNSGNISITQNLDSVKTDYAEGKSVQSEVAGIIASASGGSVVNAYNTGKIGDAVFSKGIVSRISTTEEKVIIRNVYHYGTEDLYPEDENVFVTNNFNIAEGVASKADFANGTIAQQLHDGIDGLIWDQIDPDTLPSFHFQEGTFTITYHLNGDADNSINPTEINSQDIITLQPPIREGAEFRGWFRDSALTIPAETRIAGQMGDMDFYAKWYKPLEYHSPDYCYDITDKEDLKTFAEMINGDSTMLSCWPGTSCMMTKQTDKTCFKLTADIVYNENLLKNDSTVNEGDFEEWTPIKKFLGKFDGQGHTISGLYVNDSTKHAAFFDTTTSTAQIRDFGIIDSYFRGDTTAAFAAVGSGKYTKVYNKAYVNGLNYTGGLIAVSNGDEALVIDSSYNAGFVYSSWPNGGIVAQMNAGSISNTHNEGSVKSGAPGGSVGYQIVGNLTNVYNVVNVNGFMPSGIAYSISGNLKNVYNLGNVESTSGAPASGIAYQIKGDIDSVYNKGLIFCNTISSGIAYSISGNVTNSYNEGNVIGEGTAAANGFSYSIMGNVQNVYNTGSINSEQSNANGIAASITGNVDNAYNTGNIYGGGGNSNEASAGIAAIISGTTTNVYNEGDVTSDFSSAYGITTAINNDIDGVYNTGNITAYNYAMGIADSIGGSVSNTFNTGNIQGIAPAYGIAQKINGFVRDSYNEGNISSSVANAGGIAGTIHGPVERTHNTGIITASYTASGLAESIEGIVYDSYNTGNVSTSQNGGGYASGIAKSITGDISVVFNKGNIESGAVASGIADNITGSVKNVYNEGNLTAVYPASGIAQTINGDVDSAYNTGDVTSTKGATANGIAASINGNIRNSYNTGNMKAVVPAAGIAYSISGNITNTFNTGSVTSTDYWASGITNSLKENKVLANCYNTGNITGKNYAAGIVNESQGYIRNVYNTGAISITQDFIEAQAYPDATTNLTAGITNNVIKGGIVNAFNTGLIGTSIHPNGIASTFHGDNSKIIRNVYHYGTEDLYPDDENVFTANNYNIAEGVATEADFRNGAITEKLRSGIDGLIWNQNASDSLPKFYFQDGEFTANYYNVGGISPVDFTAESILSIPAEEPTRNGAIFAGWFRDEDLTIPAENIIAGQMGDVSYYAKWDLINYNIDYVLDGGTNDEINPATYTVEDTMILASPAKTGYTFLGWFSDAAFSHQAPFISKGSTGDKTFYAAWEENAYTITYDLDGGTNAETNPASYTVNDTVTLATPSKNGYTFLGWFDNESLSGDAISGISKGSIGEKKFFAKWSLNTYVITYKYADGSNPESNPTSYTVHQKVVFENPSISGYTFDGWYSDSTFKSVITKLDSGSVGDTTIYAKWSINSYTITYMLNGGVNSASNPKTYTVNSTVSLYTPTKTGYTFNGWFSDSTFTTKVTTIAKGSIGAKIFYAKWTPIVYSIAYYMNSGINDPSNPTSYTVEDKITLAAPTKRGYTFDSWYKESSYTTKTTGIDSGSIGSKSFYAKWTLDSYKITYNLDGGTNSASNPANYTINSAVTFYSPTKLGYTFGGWYSDTTFTTAISKIATGSIGDTAVFAKWTINNYGITYNLNGGTNSASNPATYTVKDSVILYNPTKLGYTFGGWYSNSTLTTKVTSIAKGSTGAKTFYAKWTPTAYTITYYMNSGTNAAANPTSYTIEDAVTLATPTRPGYTFNGWFKESTFVNKVTGIDVGSTGAKSFYAMWTVNNYTITYELDGGVNSISNPATYTVDDSVTLYTPTKLGYTFGGWYSNSTFTIKVTSIAKGSIGAKTFYAKWTPTAYAITYYMNSGTNAAANPTSYTIEDAVTLATPTRLGYTFDGWFKESTFANKVTGIDVGSTGAKSFYAKWTVNNYTITYELDGGVNSASNPATYTVNGSVTLYTPTKTGYSFGGWYRDADLNYKITSIALGSVGDTTVYAKWTPVNYIITYNVKPGTNSAYNPTYYTIEDTIHFEDPTRIYYTFEGWYLDSAYTEPVSGISVGSIGGISIYAKWSLDHYTITYHLDGGTNSGNNVSEYTYKDNFTLEAPEKRGYSFVGWFSNEAKTINITEIAYGSSGDLDIYAEWYKNKYNIIYNLNGGNNNPSNPTRYTVDDEIVLAPPTWTGHTFEGWFSDETFENKITSIEQGSIGNIRLYAKWTLNNYIITYELDGGENHVNNKENYSYGKSIEFKDPTKIGYTFLGWFSDAAMENRITGISSYATGDTTVYAKWSRNTYSIVYLLHSGTNSIYNPYQYTVDDGDIILAEPTRRGYMFEGWFKDSLQQEQVTVIEKGTTENFRLDSKWTPINYEIVYNLNGGTNSNLNPATYTTDKTLNLDPAYKSGYTFMGWFSDSACTVSASRIVSGTIGTQVVFAKWKINSYTVAFYNYDNRLLEKQNVRFGEDAEAPKVPEREGYEFSGWNRTFTKIVADIDVYATFEEVEIIESSSSEESSSSVASSSSGNESSSSVASSSSSDKSSSSSATSSSSSEGNEQNVFAGNNVPAASVIVRGNTLDVHNAPIGEVLMVFDMQGKIVRKVLLTEATASISIPRSGAYLVRLGSSTRRITVK